MTAVILQPAGDPHAREHYADTIATPVAQERLARFLDADDMDEIRVLYGSEAVPTWGVTPGATEGNLRKWDRIANGDLVLMSRDGAIFVSARVTYKTRNEALAVDLWDRNDEGATWECIYFLDDVTPQALPRAELNAIVDYEPGARVQGFNVLDATKSTALLDALDMDREVPATATTRPAAATSVQDWREPPEIIDVLDSVARAAGRTRRKPRRRLSRAEIVAIETLAVRRATDLFESEGWTTEDVGSSASYDLRCRMGDRRLHVEVKGTTSRGEKIVLTRNEVAHARGTDATVALFVWRKSFWKGARNPLRPVGVRSSSTPGSSRRMH